MRRFVITFSIMTVINTSCALRHGVRLPDRNRFLASCWLMVEPPATILPLTMFFIGLLDRLPVEAVVVEKLGILGRDQCALEIDRDALVGHPFVAQRRPGIVLLQDFQPFFHERAGGGIEPDPPDHVAEEPELVDNDRGEHEGDAPPGPAQQPLHWFRSSSMTGRVSGRMPRHRKNDSAVCSTSMPRPSARRVAPWDCASARKGVSPLPYIMS